MAVGTYIFNVVLFSIIIAVCFTNPGEASTCSPEHHKCEISTDKCIPKKWVCDGERDCNSGSDELSCPNKTCTDKQFMCKTSRMCIAEAWRCDGQSDCIDKSDEANCHNKTCTEDEFMCKTDQSCISKTWKCDGQNDCADGSDEISCSLNKTCPDEGFLCKTNQKCIHKNWRCDGDRDCVDGSDELNCSNTTCAADQFMCQTSKKCMPKRWLCDGDVDCQDGSDEINCNVTTATCSPKEFMCESKPTHCILKAWACDGDPDCPDGSDEKNCSQIVCSSNEFQCKNRMACVLLSFVCNGNADCKDGSDEWNCTKVVTCSENQFKCDNETCVDAAMRCDGTKDCFNGRDETGCQPEVTEVLLADRNSLKMVTLYGNYKKAVSRRISHSGTQHAMVGVDYDYDDDLVFWTDNSQSSIFCARFLNASSSVTDERVVQDSNIDIPDGIAVDWVNNLIYWTDTGRNEISVSNYNATMRKVLVSEDLDEPRAIVVNPFTGWMYWTDWGVQAKIDRAGMDGQQRSTIVSTNLQWPNGITLDSYDDRLYWIDAKTNTVESSLTDGSDRRVISSGVIGHGFAVTTSEFNIYITSWRDRGVIGVSKIDGHVTNYINEMSDSIVQPMGVKVYNKAMQRQKTSICYTNEFECEYLCLPRPSNTKQRSTNVKYTCACPDGRTCHTSTTEPEVKSTSTTVTSPTSTPDVLTNVTTSISTSTPISVTSSTVDLSSTSSSNISTPTPTAQTSNVTTTTPTSPLTRSDIDCGGSSISLHVPLDLLPSGQQVTWNDPACVVSNNGTHLTGDIDLGECGTYVFFNATHVIFENELVSHASTANSTSGAHSVIDYGNGPDSVIVVQCVYPRREQESLGFRPIQGQVRLYEKTLGHMQVHMREARDVRFDDMYPSQTEPRVVHLNDPIYIKLDTEQGNTTKVAINVDRCLATPSPSPLDTDFQELTDNGCPALPSVTIHSSPVSEVHLSFQAFKFTNHPSAPVYVHCEVYVCPLSDPHCVTGCTDSVARTRRAATGGIKTHLVSTGPFPVADDKDQGGFGGESTALVAVTGLCAVLAVAATIFGVMAWRGRRRLSLKEPLVQ